MEAESPEIEHARPPMSDGTGNFVPAMSPSMKDLEGVVAELANSHVPVLVIGEIGTGKRATAYRIHDLSPRRHDGFRAVVSGQVGSDALTNGSAGHLLSSGTTYFEEVGDLNPDCQLILLNQLHAENGAQSEGARLIFGTARDLQAEVRGGRFREDFYYRISGVSLRLPPLRQRKEDITLLLDFFLSKYAADFHCTMPTVSDQTRQLFIQHAWPGNLRELEDAAKALVVLGDGALAMDGLRSLLIKPSAGNGQKVSLKDAARAASREAEKQLILKVLTRTRWNRRRAAQELQISYKALLYKLKQIGLGELGGAS